MKDCVLIIFGRDKSGGAEQILKNLAIYLHNHQHKVVAISTHPKKFGFWDDYKGEIYFTTPWFDKFNIIHFSYLVYKVSRKYGFSIAISSFVSTNGILGWMRKYGILRAQHIVARESTQIYTRADLKYKFIFDFFYKGYKYADLVVCQTNLMKQHLLENVATVSKLKVNTIANPINKIDIQTKANEVINDITAFGNYIVACGRLKQLKGFEDLISAYISNSVLHQFNLVIIGEGIYRTYLEQLAGSFLNKQIFLVGYKVNPLPFFKQAKICVICSHNEGFPNTLLQMMAVNNNVVSTLCADGIQNINGIITCKISSPNDLGNALHTAIACSDETKIMNRKLYDDELNQRTYERFYDEIKSILK